MNDLAEDYYKYMKKNFVALEMDDFGSDSYTFIWVPENHVKELQEIGSAFNSEYSLSDIKDVIWDGGDYFDPSELSDDARKYFEN